MMIRKYSLFTALALTLFSALAQAGSEQLEIRDAWIKQLPPVVPVRAGYVTIVNPGTTPLRLVAASGEDFDRVEMHETQTVDGTMKMLRRESFDIPPKGSLRLQPGGKHLMLFDPARPLVAGDKTEIELQFDDGGSRRVPFEIKP